MTPRPFASASKHGGLYHWRIGRFGGSLYMSRKPATAPRMPAWPAALGALAGIALAACSTAPAAPMQWHTIVETSDGNQYVTETRADIADCFDAAQRYKRPGTLAWCERYQ